MARYRSTGDPTLDLGILAASVGIVLLVRLGVRNWPKVVYCMAPKTTEFAKVRYVHASAFSWTKRGDETDHIHTASFQLEDGGASSCTSPMRITSCSVRAARVT